MILTATLASVAIATCSITGALFFGNHKQLSGIERFVVPAAVGMLLSFVLYELLPETLLASPSYGGIVVAIGFIGFYVLANYLHQHFHAKAAEDCDRKTAAALLLTGDAVHNLADGVILGTAFLIDPTIGIATAVGIALHEIPATDETPYVVCLGVGPVPERSLPTHIDSTRLAHGLVKRLTQIVTANAVLWHEDTRALSTFVMDDFQDELDSMLCYLELQLNGTTGTVEEEQKAAKPKSCAIKDEVALARLRDQLRKKGRAKAPISRPIHISLYLLACTFFLTIPAMGSALLSYVWLRDGVDKPSTPT
mgnify:CR=1 FL=1